MKQRNRQEHQLNQLQNQLEEERRQTENIVKQQEELYIVKTSYDIKLIRNELQIRD